MKMQQRPKVIRCDRCRKRYRAQDNWNINFIAGIAIGYLCPKGQTTNEDLEAELNLITGRSTVTGGIAINGPQDLTTDNLTQIIEGLVKTYPTPEVMRDRATRLAEAKGNRFWMAGLMRMVADKWSQVNSTMTTWRDR